jgi:hypothetical protein
VYDVALRHTIYGSLPSLYYGRYTAIVFVLVVVSSFQPHTRTRAPAGPKAESPRSFQPTHDYSRGSEKCNGMCATLQKLHRVVHIHQFTRYKRIIIRTRTRRHRRDDSAHTYIYTVANGHSLYPRVKFYKVYVYI